MANVLVLFYTTYGHNFTMAKAAVEGVSHRLRRGTFAG